MTSDRIRAVRGEADAQVVCADIRRSGAFVEFASQFMRDDDRKVARNALWILTKATDDELSALQSMLGEFIGLAMQTPDSSVRRLSLNVIERLEISKDTLRADFLDFCLERMVAVDELPSAQSLCMKLAYRMCRFYPELEGELLRTLQSMEIGYYKPAVRSVRSRIMSGKMR